MKQMLKFRLLLLLLLTAATTSAQSVLVKGRTVDASTGKAAGYATATLLRDSTIVDAVAASAEGYFEVKAPAKGDYRLQLTLVGYQTLEHRFKAEGARCDLGELKLREGVDIGDVVVTVQKPLVVADAEKMSYSVEDDPQASTSTLEEVIRKVPQLSLDAEGNVLLNGESNYKVLVDGRSNATMGSQFKEVIKSMPASQIKRIEVITNPSTKYESEGVGGIINLITDRSQRFEGYNGSLSGGANLYGSPMYYGSGNTSIQSGRFAIGVMAYYSHYAAQDKWAMQTESRQENFGTPGQLQQTESLTPYRGNHYGATLDLSYAIDTLNLITLNGSFYSGKNRMNDNWSMTEILTKEAEIQSRFGSLSEMDQSYLGASVSLGYEHTFRRPGHTLTLSDEWEISPNESNGLYQITGYEAFDSYSTQRDEQHSTMGNTLQIDYVNPLNLNHNIEAGLKHIFRSSESDAVSLDPTQEGSAEASLDRMEYRQHILALYAGYGFNFTKWSGRIGTRLEQTWNRAKVTEPESSPYSFDNNLTNLVPYASITFRPKQRHSLSLSYTQRLQRPSIEWLSPAVDDSQPLSRKEGNPDLKSAIYHTFNLQYGFFAPKWSLMAGATARLSNNNMTTYTYQQSGITYHTYSDKVHSRYYGLNASLSLRPSQRLNLSFTVQGGYNDLSFAPQGIYTDRFSFSENLNLDVALWKEGRLMVGEYYNSGDGHLGGWTEEFWYYYAGLKQSLFKKRLDLSLMVTNPFNGTTEWENHTSTPTYAGYSKTVMKSRSVSLRISWRFGKQNVQVKRTSRTIQNDDVQQSAGQSPQPGGAGAGMGI